MAATGGEEEFEMLQGNSGGTSCWRGGGCEEESEHTGQLNGQEQEGHRA